MPQKAIREFDGKTMIARWFNAKIDTETSELPHEFVQVHASTNLSEVGTEHPWLTEKKLVVKVDQLIKRRGKAGLVKLNCSWPEAVQWIEAHRGKEHTVERVTGIIDHFIIEPFLPHQQDEEYYFCIQTKRSCDEILFYHQGGVDVGDVDAKAVRIEVAVDNTPSPTDIAKLLVKVPSERVQALVKFVQRMYDCFVSLQYSYLEINPLVVVKSKDSANKFAVVPLDLAAKIDEAAKFECSKHWGNFDFPPLFGRPLLPEEAYVAELDSKTGASLKLTVLNPKGRIWTMVAGGGASVVYADTLVDLGAGDELANYGEYSGDPSESLTYEYAKTILSLMTKNKDERGKILIIGGGIANFTNVADTFKGIIRALTEFVEKLKEFGVRIYVRRGGPNYQEALSNMKQLAIDLDLPIFVHGPELHMTSIVSLALGKELPNEERPGASPDAASPVTSLNLATQRNGSPSVAEETDVVHTAKRPKLQEIKINEDDKPLFTSTTKAFVFGMQPNAVQRTEPSVAAMVYPFSGNHFQKFYWRSTEILMPIYQNFTDAAAKFPDVDTVVNFASSRSVFESTTDILEHKQIKTIAIIAEGVPERRTRSLISMAQERGATIIGPATVGGIKPGCFRIGNTGGMLDNIIASKLYRPGSVGYVARSGGLSNEMNNIVSRNADGVYEGIAIGGDMYPGTTFMDHILRFQKDSGVKIIVLLGEVGGVEEYTVCDALKNGVITKPIVAWCIGTCAKIFPYEVQFGHAGACASSNTQTASAKNKALRLAGAFVPDSFQEFGQMIKTVYQKLVADGTIQVRPEVPPPQIPVDYSWARKLGLIRKPSNFISSISDDRGEELIYAGMTISEVLENSMGIGGVVGLLWFRRKLPDYFCRFIEIVLMVTADHGPAVSGAHNTIVCARAGKDLISSLASGLLTIGPRFGGALDEAAASFADAYDSGMTPEDFVENMRKKKQLIMGIGHKVKSLENPDQRVVLIKDFVKKNFKSTEVFDYALEVEQITTRKKSSLILNVDGAVGVAFVDLLRSCGAFATEEANEFIKLGVLNGLFVLGRSIGLIGHFIDQNRLKQPLYRHPTEDISYISQDLRMN